jgi:hypothetical protein
MKQEIPHSDWQEFFNSFKRKHQTWLISVEENGATPILHQPLEEIGVDQGKIWIKAGQQAILLEPFFVMLVRNEEGADETIEIKTQSGRVSLKVDNPTLPEMVDGVP